MEGEGVEKRGHVTTGLDGAEKSAQWLSTASFEGGKRARVCMGVCVRVCVRTHACAHVHVEGVRLALEVCVPSNILPIYA